MTTKLYHELLEFHIGAQTGMFIDETVRLPGEAGILIFSEHETEPTWNVCHVLDCAAVLSQTNRISAEFARRHRQPCWYVAECLGVSLPHQWRSFGSDNWMVCEADAYNAAVPPPPFALRLVESAADADLFNQLYLDVFWDGAPDPGAALPLGADAPTFNGHYEARHWLALRPDEGAVAALTILARDGLAAIYNVGTRRDRRGQGLGGAIMRATMAAEARRGVKRFFLLTERDKPLVSFYERLGFGVVTRGHYLTLA